jgi:hypothetical protein
MSLERSSASKRSFFDQVLGVLVMDKHDTIKLPSKGTVLRVLYNFSGDGDKKMTLRAGETVTFLELTQGGWARGFDSRGRNGFFPFAFLGPNTHDGSQTDEEEEDSVAEVDSLIESLQKKGSGLSGEAEAKALASNNNASNSSNGKGPTVRYEVKTKTVKRTPATPPPAKTGKEPEKTAAKEIKRPPSPGSASAPHSPVPVPLPVPLPVAPSSPPPERSATLTSPTTAPPKRPQGEPVRESAVVAYSTTMLPAVDPMANVMHEIRQSKRKKEWKIGATRAAKVADAATTGNIRINSLLERIKQLEQENKELQGRVGRCRECGSERVVCLVCEARREKPLPVPRDSVWQSLEDAANANAPLDEVRSSADTEEAIASLSLAAKQLPLPRDSVFSSEELRALSHAQPVVVSPDVQTLGDLAGPNPLKKPLPIPRDSTMPDPEGLNARESAWFFPDDSKK